MSSRCELDFEGPRPLLLPLHAAAGVRGRAGTGPKTRRWRFEQWLPPTPSDASASLRLRKRRRTPRAGRQALRVSIDSRSSASLGENSRRRTGCPGASSTAGPPHTSSSAGRCDLDFMFFRIRSAACSKLRAGQNKLGSTKESTALLTHRKRPHRLRNAAQRYDDIQQACLSATQPF